ncbi:hypothetical protein [Methylobacterium sp. J-067]|uniref:hypothetical protein n=1 Tax=Methylobacterium sp. J-067 TaxID=2836648 RepID=UPI001FBAA21A|nr:hypothetical protein [Methylobacterium sp. J-067]MCJ2023607.1 hypothetical protein [Methylobacterium sp. J-067]
MPKFKLCVAVRDTNGMLGEPVHEQVLMAPDAREAVTLAKAADLDMAQLMANALYLVDQNGHVVWSLRLADASNPIWLIPLHPM